MIEEINFKENDNDYRVYVQIDNEKNSFEIKEIDKLSTYIELNQSSDTALEENIKVDASIYYIKKQDNTEETDIEIEETSEDDDTRYIANKNKRDSKNIFWF